MNDNPHPTVLALALAGALFAATLAGAADTSTTTSGTSANATSTTAPGTTSTTTLSPGQSRVIARTADTFTPFAGSRPNAESLAIGLRTGSEITLTGSGTDGQTTSTTFTPPTKPMGHGNVSKSLALSSQQLAAAGVAQPTPDQIKTSMLGGTITNDAGQQIEMQGVLQMRADGMGWGQIAHQLGVKPGQGYRPAHTASGVTTTAAGTTSSGIVSAKGRQSGTTGTESEKQSKAHAVSSHHSGSGIVTAAGGSAPSLSKGVSHRAQAPTSAGNQSGGVVHAGGHGQGVVSATGGSVSHGQGGGGGLAKGHAK